MTNAETNRVQRCEISPSLFHRRLAQTKTLHPPIARESFGEPLMARTFTGLLFLALPLASFGCSSSSPMRFQFTPGGPPVTVRVDEGGVESGDQTKVFELKSNDTEKRLEIMIGGRKIYGKMDVFG